MFEVTHWSICYFLRCLAIEFDDEEEAIPRTLKDVDELRTKITEQGLTIREEDDEGVPDWTFFTLSKDGIKFGEVVFYVTKIEVE